MWTGILTALRGDRILFELDLDFEEQEKFQQRWSDRE